MNEWEVENELVDKDLPNFEETLNKAVFLTKFAAVIAKKILLVSKDNAVDTNKLMDAIEGWINKLKK